MDYSQLAELVFSAAKAAEADAELYITNEKETNITVQQGAVEKFSFAGSKGLGVFGPWTPSTRASPDPPTGGWTSPPILLV